MRLVGHTASNMSQITPSNYSSPEISQNVLERPEQNVKTVSPSPFCFTLTPTRWILWIAGLGGLAFLVLLGCLRFGTESIDFVRMVAILFEGMRLGGEERNVADPTSTILLQIRLPRVVLAFMVGGSLAAVGGRTSRRARP